MSAEDRPVVSAIQYGEDGTAISVQADGSMATVSRGMDLSLFGGIRETFLTTTATTTVVARSGFWTDFGTGAQRSIKSTSANDSAAGTGVRTVRVTYYRSDGSGPFTEDKTMNGTTGVAFTETDMRFVDHIEALTVGSNGSAVGNIDLVENSNGTGGSLARLLTGNNKTFFAQHWVPPGMTTHLASIFVASMGTSGAGSAGRVLVRTQALLTANAVTQDRVFGFRVAPDETTRNVVAGAPLQIAGPCLVNLWFRPDTTTSTQWFLGFSFYDS